METRKTKHTQDDLTDEAPLKKRRVETVGEVLEEAGFDSNTYQRIVSDNQVWVFVSLKPYRLGSFSFDELQPP